MRKAFTLAEVLITLAIIGVIAALTVPTILRKYNDRVIVSKVKKGHAMLSNAFKIAEQQNGDLIEYMEAKEASGIIGSQAVLDYLSDSLKIVKDCGISQDGTCRPISWYGCNRNRDKIVNYRMNRDRCVLLQDGMLFCINREVEPSYTCTKDTSVCAHMYLDINGLKGPNMHSIDHFAWYYDKNKKFATGSNKFDNNHIGCQNSENAGSSWGMSNSVLWILMKNNVDYLYNKAQW